MCIIVAACAPSTFLQRYDLHRCQLHKTAWGPIHNNGKVDWNMLAFLGYFSELQHIRGKNSVWNRKNKAGRRHKRVGFSFRLWLSPVQQNWWSIFSTVQEYIHCIKLGLSRFLPPSFFASCTFNDCGFHLHGGHIYIFRYVDLALWACTFFACHVSFEP